MKKDIKNYLPFYLGCEVYVQKKQGNESLVKGRICEVTSGSNHGDWIMVQFANVVKFMYYNFNERCSNFHTFFIGEDFIKLSLRPLSDMTEDEEKEVNNHGSNGWRLINPDGDCKTNKALHLGVVHRQAAEVAYLLSRGFDLFGLIEVGLAIDKTTLKQTA